MRIFGCAVLALVVAAASAAAQGDRGKGKGDNRDDLKSGKVDRVGDGNSGQGDDRKLADPVEKARLECDHNRDGKLDAAERAKFLEKVRSGDQERLKASLARGGKTLDESALADLAKKREAESDGQWRALKEKLGARDRSLEKHECDKLAEHLRDEEGAALKREVARDPEGQKKLEGYRAEAQKKWTDRIHHCDLDGDGKLSDEEGRLLVGQYKTNQGVRDHGVGEGKDGAGQGKGRGFDRGNKGKE